MWRYEYQDEGTQWRVYTDSDWAGCKKTRKSCSGGVLMRGSHCIRTLCSTKGANATSSAEAEFYIMVDGVLRGYEMIGLNGELGKSEEEFRVILGTTLSVYEVRHSTVSRTQRNELHIYKKKRVLGL